MKIKLTKLVYAASLVLSLALTFSCQRYKYCIRADNTCLDGPFTVSVCMGQVSNSCPNGSSSAVIWPSSSSNSTPTNVVYGDDVSYKGEIYKTIVIGTQTWFQRNLNYAAEGSRCYGYAESDCNKYGRLYDWEMAKTVCQSGWHLPNESDWNELISYVESNNGCSGCAGKHLKAKSGWSSGGNGTDTYGFAALPGGYGHWGGGVFYAGDLGYWWTVTKGTSYPYNRYMNYNSEDVGIIKDVSNGNVYGKTNFYSVRCVKD